jgi:hypothetical protein
VNGAASDEALEREENDDHTLGSLAEVFRAASHQ